MMRNNQYTDAFTKFKKNGDKYQLILKLKEIIEEDMQKPQKPNSYMKQPDDNFLKV